MSVHTIIPSHLTASQLNLFHLYRVVAMHREATQLAVAATNQTK